MILVQIKCRSQHPQSFIVFQSLSTTFSWNVPSRIMIWYFGHFAHLYTVCVLCLHNTRQGIMHVTKVTLNFRKLLLNRKMLSGEINMNQIKLMTVCQCSGSRNRRSRRHHWVIIKHETDKLYLVLCDNKSQSCNHMQMQTNATLISLRLFNAVK